MVLLTGLIVCVGLLQAWVFLIQTELLKKTVDKMDDIKEEQAVQMHILIGEIAKAATDLGKIAQSMAESAISIRDSLNVNGDLAKR
jgi:hypothetical protein